MPRHDELDTRASQRFNDVEVFFARHGENAIDTFVLERGDKKIGAFGHRGTSPYAALAATISASTRNFGPLELWNDEEHVKEPRSRFSVGRMSSARVRYWVTLTVLATERPTAGQRRLAASVVAVLFTVFGASVVIGLMAPFAANQVRINGFVAILAAALFLNDLFTATLLYGQFSIVRSRALLVIASAYLFTGAMAIVFALTFPWMLRVVTGFAGALIRRLPELVR